MRPFLSFKDWCIKTGRAQEYTGRREIDSMWTLFEKDYKVYCAFGGFMNEEYEISDEIEDDLFLEEGDDDDES